MTNEPTDDEILAQSLLRPRAFGDLYQRHAPAVHAFLTRRAGSAAADDLLGDVFVTALEARVRFRPHTSGSALPWLYGISANLVREHLRRRRPDALIDTDVGVDWHAVDERIDAHAQRDQLRRALAALSPAEREAFLLTAWEGLSTVEAAQALDTTATVVRARLSRARQRARAVLASAPTTSTTSR